VERKEGQDLRRIQALPLRQSLQNVPYTVAKIVQQERQRHPFPPFITSRLQQEAYRKLSFSAKKTMRIAQSLYEGVELGTWGAWDSSRICGQILRASSEAIHQVRLD
jgi:DNA topoisomerase-1